MRGLKMRAPQSDIFLDTIRAMGANPTPLTFGAVFSSLQTHLIDGAENNWPSYQSSRQFEVARFWSQTEHSFAPDALLMSKASLERLSAVDPVKYDGRTVGEDVLSAVIMFAFGYIVIIGILAAPMLYASVALSPLLVIKGFEAVAVGGFAGLADGHDDAAPVCILARKRCLHER